MRQSLDRVVTGLIALGGLALAGVLIMGMIWQGPAVRRDVCGDCGLHRKRSVWHLPGTRFAVFWRGQQTNSVVGQVLQRQPQRSEWKHRWIPLEEYQLSLVTGALGAGSKATSLNKKLAAASAKRAPSEFPARKLAYQFDSQEVARFVDALHKRRAGKETVVKWMQWLGNPEVSPFVLGVAVRFGQEETLLREPPALESWLAAKEATLLFGHPPPSLTDANQRQESRPQR
jgi:hypothetical protein